MMGRSIAVGLLFLSGLGVACREAPQTGAIPPDVPGSYVYAAKGATLKKLQWEFAAKLELKPDGTFALALDKSMAGERDTTEHTTGTYAVSGDKLWLRGQADDSGRQKQFPLMMKHDSLVGDISWKAHLVLRGLGAPDPVFVKETASYSAK